MYKGGHNLPNTSTKRPKPPSGTQQNKDKTIESIEKGVTKE